MTCTECGLSTDELRPPDAEAFFGGLWRRYRDLLETAAEDGDDAVVAEIEAAMRRSHAVVDRLGAALSAGYTGADTLEQAGHEVAAVIKAMPIAAYDTPLPDGSMPLPFIRQAVHDAAHAYRLVARKVG